MIRSMLWPAGLVLCGLAAAQKPAPAAAQPAEGPVQIADIQAFSAWLHDYKAGAVRLVKDGKTDEAALADLDARMAKIAQWNSRPAARMLFEAASTEPRPAGAPSSAELIDYYRELQPWRVQALAIQHLRTITCDGVMPWL